MTNVIKEALEVDLSKLEATLKASDAKVARNEARQQRLFARLRETEGSFRALEGQFARIAAKAESLAKRNLRTAASLGVGIATAGGSETEQLVGAGIGGLLTGQPFGALTALAFAFISQRLAGFFSDFREFAKRFEVLEKSVREDKKKLRDDFAELRIQTDKSLERFRASLGERFRTQIQERLYMAARYSGDVKVR